MLTAEQCIGFLLAVTVVTAAPGPDNLMVLSIGMAKGRRSGMAFGLGCALGCLSHTLLAVVGMSALIVASPQAFFLLQLSGGIYLVWLGFNALRSLGRPLDITQSVDTKTSLELFFKGMFANAINPKVMFFFLSFLPQFVVTEAGAVAWQLAQLGVIFTLQAALFFSLLGFFSGIVGHAIRRRPAMGLCMDRMAGLVFVGLGVRLMASSLL